MERRILHPSPIHRLRWSQVIIAACFVMVSAVVHGLPLNDDKLQELRYDGYCTEVCSRGSPKNSYGMMLRLSEKTRNPKKFAAALQEYISFDEEDDDQKERDEIEERVNLVLRRMRHMKLQAYCAEVGIQFEDCTLLEKLVQDDVATHQCVENCVLDLKSNINSSCPSVESMAEEHREFLQCMLDFDPDKVTLDFQQDDIDLEESLAIMDKYGFVAFRNFFSPGRMREIHELLVRWRHTWEWEGRQYADFAGKVHLHRPRFREEVVIPNDGPFEALLQKIRESDIWTMMDRYVSHPGLHLDYVTSILSDPGATKQSVHADVPVPRRYLKGNLSIHPMRKENGPTGFCPCTHMRGPFYHSYGASHIVCPLHYQPDFVDAGTLVIYDQALDHQGMDNTGNSTRYILDIGYRVGAYDEGYLSNFPSFAVNQVLKSYQK